MIIRREDNFSRKSKSSVKVTSEISISSSRNDESMKIDIFKKPLLHTTESDITSNRRRSRKKLINCMKRTHPSSIAESSSCTLFCHNNEFLSHIQERWISVKGSSSNYSKIECVSSFSGLESVGNIFENKTTRGNPDSERNNFTAFCGLTNKNENISAVNCVKQSQSHFESLQDRTSKNDGLYCADKKAEFLTLHKEGRQEIIVFNVRCYENRQKQEHPCSSNPSYDAFTTSECSDDGTLRKNTANKAKHKGNPYDSGAQPMNFRSCNLKDTSIKKRYSKGKPIGHCSYYVPIAENCDDYLTSEAINYELNGCEEDCIGTPFVNLHGDKDSHKLNNQNNSEYYFPTLSNCDTFQTSVKIPKTSVQKVNARFCECCSFPNCVNVDEKYLQKLHDIEFQGIPDDVYERRISNQGIKFSQLSPDPQSGLFENTPNADNLMKFSEDNLKAAFPPTDIATHKRNPHEEVTTNLIPTERRKRQCTLCRSGRVDEDELKYYEDGDNKTYTNFIKTLGANQKDELKEDRRNLKLNEKRIGYLPETHNKHHNANFDRPEQITSLIDSPIPQLRTPNKRITKIPLPSIRNTKNEFCGGNHFVNYVNVDPKYQHKVHQGIPHKITDHRRNRPNCRSYYVPHRTRNRIFGDCSCKIYKEIPKDFKKPEQFNENDNLNLFKASREGSMLSGKIDENADDNLIMPTKSNGISPGKMDENDNTSLIKASKKISIVSGQINENVNDNLIEGTRKNSILTEQFNENVTENSNEVNKKHSISSEQNNKNTNENLIRITKESNMLSEQINETVNDDLFKATKKNSVLSNQINKNTNENCIDTTKESSMLSQKFNENDNLIKTTKKNSVLSEHINDNASEKVIKITKNISDTKLPEKLNRRLPESDNSLKPLPRKRRSCTLCRSGIVDEGELTLGTINEDDIHNKTSKTDKVPHETRAIRPSQKPDERKDNAITETRAADESLSKNEEETTQTDDLGRNITIKILPNYCTNNTCFDKRNGEHVTSPIIIEEADTNPNKISQKQIDRRKSEEKLYKSDLSGRTMLTCSGHCWKTKRKNKQNNKWWSCGWRRKKYASPYGRNAQCRITQDCCTSIDDISSETDRQPPVPVSCNNRAVTMQNYSSRRGCSTKPVCSTTRNKEENMLKYMRRLNKTILQDLLATPCPSTSTAHIQTCMQDTRQIPPCVDSSPYDYNVKPLTVNQCCQYENVSGVRESTTLTNENKALCECLRDLTKKLSHIENRLESDDDYDNHPNLDYNNCCCCCNRIPRCCCCSSMKTIPQKPSKKIKSCTQSRSVEVIRPLRDCATSTSRECMLENACTNTEIRPKMSRAVIRKKYKHQCKPPCCHCCRQTPCCPCDPDSDKDSFENTQIVNFQYQCEIPFRQRDQIMYNCQSDHDTPLCQPQCDLKKRVVMETKDTSTTEYQSVKSCQCNESKSEVKSTNTSAFLEYAQITNDEFMKSVTLDLCNLGDKALSKFGVPSRQYPWSSQNFLPNMPNEIYRFIRTESYHIPITEQLYDPTPCLRPEILNINNSKNVSKDIQLIAIANKSGSADAAGDIKEESSKQIKNLTSICEEMFTSEERGPETSQNCVNLECKLQFSNEFQLPQCIDPNELLQKAERPQADNNPVNCGDQVYFEPEPTDVNVGEDSTKFKSDNLPQQKIDMKREKSGIKLTNKRTVDSIQSKKDQRSRTFVANCNGSTYMPKPFTTKTGLMSFIPPFRDTVRSCTHVNKTKQKPPTGSLSRSSIKKNPIKKTRNTANITQARHSKNTAEDKKNPKDKQNIASDGEEAEGTIIVETDSEAELKDTSKENDVLKNKNGTDFSSRKKSDAEKCSDNPSELNTVEVENYNQHEKNEKTNVRSTIKFDDIYSFYDKCFKPSKKPKTVMSVPYFKTNVADIVKRLEFKRSSTTKSFLHSLVGSVVNSENETETSLKNFLFEENIKTKKLIDLSDNEPIYENFFRKSSYQSAVQIPQKILSKTDLISLK